MLISRIIIIIQYFALLTIYFVDILRYYNIYDNCTNKYLTVSFGGLSSNCVQGYDGMSIMEGRVVLNVVGGKC